MSLKYQVRDLVNVTQEFGCRTFLILEIREDGYLALEMRNKKRYPLLDDQIEVKVGEVEENAPILYMHTDKHDSSAAESYCNEQARGSKTESARWLFLAKLKPGTTLRLIHRKFIHQAVFVRLNLDRPQYPIRAKIKGLAHDFRLDALVDLQPTKTGV